ncbi:MAG: CapA family protein [Oscillospiraceae bacterium]|nr:CapA family protein [Oscillospiraceae bacterium]
MKRRNTLHPAPQERRLRAKDRMMILSRRDRMGKAMPTWYRVLAAVLVLGAALVLVNGARLKKLQNRSVKPEPLVSGTLRLAFTGELDLGGNVSRFGQSLGYDALFTGVAPLWQDASYVFSSLEGTVLPADAAAYPAADTAEEPISIPAQALEAAGRAGINALGLANDHSLDYGSRGLEASVEAVRSLGLEYAGAGEDLPAAGMYKVLEAQSMRIGFVACSAVNPNGPGPIDDYCLATTAYSELYRNVLLAEQETDYVVVYVCWGEPDSLLVSEAQRRVAHQLIQSGADLVIGSHPKLLQPVEQYQDGWIFYSLGSLVSDRDQRGERESVLVRLDLDPAAGTGAFTLIPLLLEDYSPSAVSRGFYLEQIRQSLLRELPEGSYSVGKDGRITIPLKSS